MTSKSIRRRRNKIKRQWKTLPQIGNPYGLSRKQISVILQEHGLIDDNGRPTEKAISKNFATHLKNDLPRLSGLFWSSALVTNLILSLGHSLINPFLSEARSVAKNIRIAWQEGDRLAAHNEDRMAIWSYEEGMYHFETFLRKLPPQDKMEALCEVCQCLLNYKPKMSKESIDIIFKNAQCNITMDDIENHQSFLQQRIIEKSLPNFKDNATNDSRKI